jgi:hypothetical protein
MKQPDCDENYGLIQETCAFCAPKNYAPVPKDFHFLNINAEELVNEDGM